MSAKERKGKIYARSATLGQEGSAPLDAQVAACTKLAESLGHVIGSGDILTEVGSGLDLDRPQMNKVRLMAANGEFDALFVDDPERLSRDLADLLMLMREFKSRDVEVHFVQGQSASALLTALFHAASEESALCAEDENGCRNLRSLYQPRPGGR